MDIEGKTVHLNEQELKGTVLIETPFEATDTNLIKLAHELDAMERSIDAEHTVDGEVRTIESGKGSKEIAGVLKTRSLMKLIAQKVLTAELNALPDGDSPYE